MERYQDDIIKCNEAFLLTNKIISTIKWLWKDRKDKYKKVRFYVRQLKIL